MLPRAGALLASALAARGASTPPPAGLYVCSGAHRCVADAGGVSKEDCEAVCVAPAPAPVPPGPTPPNPDLPRLPGVNVMGNAFDLLTATRDGIDASVGSVFNFRFNRTTGDGNYVVPWSVMVGPNPVCDRATLADEWKTTYEHDKTTTSGLSIGGGFGGITGSYSRQTRRVRNLLQTEDVLVSSARTKCLVNTLTLLPGYAPLSTLFLQAVAQLPDEYTEASAPQFHAFFQTWQTHVVTRCSTGGVLEQLSKTDNRYLKTHTEDYVQTEVKFSFIVSADITHSKDVVVDKSFENDTTFEGVVAHGGLIADDDDTWASWARSVQSLQLPACLDWSAIELPDVLLPPWSAAGTTDVAGKVPALRAGLNAWFTRPGCMDQAATNYNESALQDDGSCLYYCWQKGACSVSISGWPGDGKKTCSDESIKHKGVPTCSWEGTAGQCGGGGCGKFWQIVAVNASGVKVSECEGSHKCPCHVTGLEDDEHGTGNYYNDTVTKNSKTEFLHFGCHKKPSNHLHGWWNASILNPLVNVNGTGQ